jgi:hypothetical protein
VLPGAKRGMVEGNRGVEGVRVDGVGLDSEKGGGIGVERERGGTGVARERGGDWRGEVGGAKSTLDGD